MKSKQDKMVQWAGEHGVWAWAQGPEAITVEIEYLNTWNGAIGRERTTVRTWQALRAVLGY